MATTITVWAVINNLTSTPIRVSSERSSLVIFLLSSLAATKALNVNYNMAIDSYLPNDGMRGTVRNGASFNSAIVADLSLNEVQSLTGPDIIAG